MSLIDKYELYRKLNSIGGWGAIENSWVDGWDCAIEEAIRLLLEAAPVVEDTENSKIAELHRFHEQIWSMLLMMVALQLVVIVTLWWAK